MYVNASITQNGQRTQQLVLAASGLLAVAIAFMILFTPDVFYAGYGIRLGGNATLANELKAPAGALLAAGVVMFFGVFKREWVTFSLTTATVVYLSYGLSRVSSIALDGLPHSGMVSAAGLELAIGLTCLVILVRARRNQNR